MGAAPPSMSRWLDAAVYPLTMILRVVSAQLLVLYLVRRRAPGSMRPATTADTVTVPVWEG